MANPFKWSPEQRAKFKATMAAKAKARAAKVAGKKRWPSNGPLSPQAESALAIIRAAGPITTAAIYDHPSFSAVRDEKVSLARAIGTLSFRGLIRGYGREKHWEIVNGAGTAITPPPNGGAVAPVPIRPTRVQQYQVAGGETIHIDLSAGSVIAVTIGGKRVVLSSTIHVQ